MSEKQYVCTYEQLEAMLDRVCIGDWDRTRLKAWAELWELPGEKKYFAPDDITMALQGVGELMAKGADLYLVNESDVLEYLFGKK